MKSKSPTNPSENSSGELKYIGRVGLKSCGGSVGMLSMRQISNGAKITATSLAISKSSIKRASLEEPASTNITIGFASKIPTIDAAELTKTGEEITEVKIKWKFPKIKMYGK